MKRCSKCKINKMESEFRSKGNGLQPYCRNCQQFAQQERYRLKKDEYKESAKRWKLEAKAIVDAARSKPCMDCGIQYSPWVMQFDHKAGTVKIGNIATMKNSASREKLLAEIAKCEVVCANCHAERTYRRSHAEIDGGPSSCL